MSTEKELPVDAIEYCIAKANSYPTHLSELLYRRASLQLSALLSEIERLRVEVQTEGRKGYDLAKSKYGTRKTKPDHSGRVFYDDNTYDEAKAAEAADEKAK